MRITNAFSTLIFLVIAGVGGGLAYFTYRNGQWKDAIAAFDKSMQFRNGGDSADWFFIAMCYGQLGEKDAARKWYDQAVIWMDKNNPNNAELRRFRAEAEQLLMLRSPATAPAAAHLPPQ